MASLFSEETFESMIQQVIDEWTEDKYCDGYFAWNRVGMTYPTDPEAIQWCVQGYLMKIAKTKDIWEFLREELVDKLNFASLVKTGKHLAQLNNDNGHTEVINFLRTVLKKGVNPRD